MVINVTRSVGPVIEGPDEYVHTTCPEPPTHPPWYIDIHTIIVTIIVTVIIQDNVVYKLFAI